MTQYLINNPRKSFFILLLWLGVFLWLTGRSWAGEIPASLEALRQEIQKSLPASFVFLRFQEEKTLWVAKKGLQKMRHFKSYEPKPGTLEKEILEQWQSSQNKNNFLFRQYLSYLRKQYVFPNGPSEEVTTPFYLVTGKPFLGKTGINTHLNLPHLISQEKDFDSKKTNYVYIYLGDQEWENLEELRKNNPQRLFHFLALRSLQVIFAQTQGTSRGLDAYLHTRTDLKKFEVCDQNQGLFQGWALALNQLFSELLPVTKITADLQSSIRIDPYFVFSPDPWQEKSSTLEKLRRSWNTPQAVLSSPQINAKILYEIWLSPDIADPLGKSFSLLRQKGPGNLSQLLNQWVAVYPEDVLKLRTILESETHHLVAKPLLSPTAAPVPDGLHPSSTLFPCMGVDLWVGIPEKGHLANLNGSTPEQVEKVLRRLARRMPEDSRRAWLFSSPSHPTPLIRKLREALFRERGLRCGQFSKIEEVNFFIMKFGQAENLHGRHIMFFLQTLHESFVLVEQYYEKERKRLIQMGVL